MSQALTPNARAAYWQQHIIHCQTSALSGAKYCRQHQLAYHCFVYWRRKLSRTPDAASDHDTTATAPAFIEVRPQPTVPVTPQVGANALQLVLPNGLVIRQIQDSNLSTVRALLATLS